MGGRETMGRPLAISRIPGPIIERMKTSLSTPPKPSTQRSAAGSSHAAPAPQVRPPAFDRRRLAAVLSEHRHELALRFMQSVADWEKYAPDIAACTAAGDADLTAHLRREFYVLVDYLALFFRTGDPTYRLLY